MLLYNVKKQNAPLLN